MGSAEMNTTGLNKFRNVSLGILGLGILGSLGFGYKYIRDLSECPPYISEDACLSAYKAMTSYGKYVEAGFVISVTVALIGIVLIAIWFFMFLNNKNTISASVSPEQRQLRETDKEYARAVREAEKTYKTTVRILEKNVKQAEKAVKAANDMGQRKLAKFRSAALYEDRLETPQGTAFFEAEAIEAEASPSGSLQIRASGFQSLIESKPEQFEKAREFVGRIQTAISELPKIREEKLRAIASAATQLEEARGNLETGTASADADLARIKADTSKVEAARAMVGKEVVGVNAALATNGGTQVSELTVSEPGVIEPESMSFEMAPMNNDPAHAETSTSNGALMGKEIADSKTTLNNGETVTLAIPPDTTSQDLPEEVEPLADTVKTDSSVGQNFCTNCGTAANYAAQKFCTSCGRPLS